MTLDNLKEKLQSGEITLEQVNEALREMGADYQFSPRADT